MTAVPTSLSTASALGNNEGRCAHTLLAGVRVCVCACACACVCVFVGVCMCMCMCDGVSVWVAG